VVLAEIPTHKEMLGLFAGLVAVAIGIGVAAKQTGWSRSPAMVAFGVAVLGSCTALLVPEGPLATAVLSLLLLLNVAVLGYAVFGEGVQVPVWIRRRLPAVLLGLAGLLPLVGVGWAVLRQDSEPSPPDPRPRKMRIVGAQDRGVNVRPNPSQFPKEDVVDNRGEGELVLVLCQTEGTPYEARGRKSGVWNKIAGRKGMEETTAGYITNLFVGAEDPTEFDDRVPRPCPDG
jgi:hypothetical protein